MHKPPCFSLLYVRRARITHASSFQRFGFKANGWHGDSCRPSDHKNRCASFIDDLFTSPYQKFTEHFTSNNWLCSQDIHSFRCAHRRSSIREQHYRSHGICSKRLPFHLLARKRALNSSFSHSNKHTHWREGHCFARWQHRRIEVPLLLVETRFFQTVLLVSSWTIPHFPNPSSNEGACSCTGGRERTR